MNKYEAFECDRCKKVYHADKAKGINLIIEQFPTTREVTKKLSLCEKYSIAFDAFLIPGPKPRQGNP